MYGFKLPLVVSRYFHDFELFLMKSLLTISYPRITCTVDKSKGHCGAVGCVHTGTLQS